MLTLSHKIVIDDLIGLVRSLWQGHDEYQTGSATGNDIPLDDTARRESACRHFPVYRRTQNRSGQPGSPLRIEIRWLPKRKPRAASRSSLTKPQLPLVTSLASSVLRSTIGGRKKLSSSYSVEALGRPYSLSIRTFVATERSFWCWKSYSQSIFSIEGTRPVSIPVQCPSLFFP